MYRPIAIDASVPHAARLFITRVSDLYLVDVHAMLRLPRPEVDITPGCNFTISSALTNFISGISVTLFEPPPDRQHTARKFRDLVAAFYPWDREPPGAITDPQEGAQCLYTTFRNPLAHALGHQDPEPAGPVRITRFPGQGLSEDDLALMESSIDRPTATILRGAPTLRHVPATQATELNAESFYWGARELVRRLTTDAARMAAADSYLRPLLRP
jgi:hypothetical protein